MARFNLGTLFTNALAIVTTNWAVVVSTIVGLAALLWQTLTDIVLNQSVQAGVFAFLAVLWTLAAIRLLSNQRKARVVTIQPDYAYSITPEGMQLFYNAESENAALQIGVSFRNVGSAPLKAKVEEYRVVLGDRTLPDTEQDVTVIMPRLSPKGIRSGTFKRDAISGQVEGSLSLRLLYGPPDGPYVRRYRVKAKIHLRPTTDGKIHAADELISEADEPYEASK